MNRFALSAAILAAAVLLSGAAQAMEIEKFGRMAAQDQSVNELAAHFDVSRPAISQHLKVLLDSGLVTEERRGR